MNFMNICIRRQFSPRPARPEVPMEKKKRHCVVHRGYLVQEPRGLPEPVWLIFNHRERKVGMLHLHGDRLRTTVTPSGNGVCESQVPLADWPKTGYGAIEEHMRAAVDLLDCHVPQSERPDGPASTAGEGHPCPEWG